MAYEKITNEKFWELVEEGYEPPRHCFLIMEDGTQDWGYPLINFKYFDHHRQGGHHRQKVKFVLVDLDI